MPSSSPASATPVTASSVLRPDVTGGVSGTTHGFGGRRHSHDVEVEPTGTPCSQLARAVLLPAHEIGAAFLEECGAALLGVSTGPRRAASHLERCILARFDLRVFETDLVAGDRERSETRQLVRPGDRIVEGAQPMDATGGVELLGGVGLLPPSTWPSRSVARTPTPAAGSSSDRPRGRASPPGPRTHSSASPPGDRWRSPTALRRRAPGRRSRRSPAPAAGRTRAAPRRDRWRTALPRHRGDRRRR